MSYFFPHATREATRQKTVNDFEKHCQIAIDIRDRLLSEFIEYVPLFDYYYEERKADGCFRVLLGDFVTGEDGTGIVHIAPAFGEEDYKISCQNGII